VKKKIRKNMTISDLIKYCEIRIDFLSNSKLTYIQLADYEMVNKIELEITQTQNTLDILKNSI